MSFRRLATGAALAIAGLAAAVGIGLLANSISGDSVGLSAEPLSAGETLAPPADDNQGRGRGRGRSDERRAKREDRPAATPEANPPATTTETPAAPPTTTFEDDGGGGDSCGRGRGRGRGGDDSGSGSDDSGSGSDDSSGSGSGYDSPEFEDD